VSFVPEEPKTGQLHITWEDQRQKRLATYQVKDVKKPSADYLCYHPTLTLLASPDQFLALVPAADAVEITNKIRGEYETQFGKVQNRLPLFLGIVFFPRKMPLMAVMDTARRMLEQVEFKEETWQVECSCPSEDKLTRHLRLAKDQARIVYEVPVRMGDKHTDDLWYPYFFFQGNPTARPLRFQHNGRWLVHANDLREEDTILVTPSRFAYIFLESTAQRFRFDSQADMMLLDELPHLIKMWADLKQSGITNTGLHAVSALLETKQASWGSGQEFDRLVRTTLKEAGLPPNVVRPEDVQNGRFFRCLELYQHILKQKVH